MINLTSIFDSGLIPDIVFDSPLLYQFKIRMRHLIL